MLAITSRSIGAGEKQYLVFECPAERKMYREDIPYFRGMNRTLIKRIILGFLAVIVLFFAVSLSYIWVKQDELVQSQLKQVNELYRGELSIKKVHLAPFHDFPYISLKIDSVQLYEYKTADSPLILSVGDIYVGFQFWDIIRAKLDIQKIVIEDGFIDFLIHENGENNLQRAFDTGAEVDDSDTSAPEIHLKELELVNVDIHQRKETSDIDVETFIYWAKGSFLSNEELIKAHVDTEFELNILDNGDTTFFKHKHFEFHTDLSFNQETGLLDLKPSGINMEHVDFEISGTVDTKNDMSLDLTLSGKKPSFDLFIAFAPEELIPVLERYDNQGDIYFNAIVKGPTTDGRQPFIDAEFGAAKAYLENTRVKRRIDDLGFSGHFSNGSKRNLTSMEFSLNDIQADLEKGSVLGSVFVQNFETPEIDMELQVDFEVAFIVDFFNLDEIKEPKGDVQLKMNFHDIVDLNKPEEALKDLNQAYFAELQVKDLSFDAEELEVPLEQLNAHLAMNAKKAELDQFELKMGNSDLSITGYISDLPAIVHQQEVPINAHVEIRSKFMDVAELTDYSEEDSTGVNEQIKDLSLAFSFKALGNAFSEFEHLPKGEFFIDDLYADLQHYPHALHDFHADILIDDKDLKIVDFTGLIDKSDFHFNGLVHDYGFWMGDSLHGDVQVDLSIRSDLLRLEDLMSYRGENFVPPDYRHEELEGLKLHLELVMHYDADSLRNVEVHLDKFQGKMHVHPLAFRDFEGRFAYGDEHVKVEEFKGKLGRTDFDIKLNHYLGEDSLLRKRDNVFELTSNFIDFDALTNFNEGKSGQSKAQEPVKDKSEDVEEHAEAFNIYELPFTAMQFNVDVDHFIYHRLDLQNISAQMRTTHQHYLYLDRFDLDAAGGHISMTGYFNGSDPMNIYLKPDMKVDNVELDKLLFKFENFGQDEIVSENLHGRLYADIKGNIRVYPDMVPDLDRSEVHMDVMVLEGRLENYDPILLMSDYFGDKDLTNIKFDTLQNHMDIIDGNITIPNMTIESTLGHMDIAGTQDMNDNIDYYVRIPWSLIKDATKNKLFGPKDAAQKEDEIVELDPKKKTKYLNVNLTGTIDDYKVRMRKAKEVK